MLAAGSIVHTHHWARLSLSDPDDRYTAGKSMGLVPVSGEIHAEGVGFVDQTLFYKAVVTPDEVAWLAEVPEVAPFDAPGPAPRWWSVSLWWHGWTPGMKYFRTNGKWPCLFAYSRRKGVVYGVVEIE
ncbi:hypothetical protein OVA24_17200 [Luteolibacter sp. SL250]|uniref:hypothetical protein n=1 Tax=Luteolibacter sp. SL250 TaxID=2995170 RepID=UPI00226E52A5|nr:hypothetical protein [Luteolibacter sp. SL250]WAC18970.1 hypothetical protein OVA24_17200 [Luteolibacter sp. SL250]